MEIDGDNVEKFDRRSGGMDAKRHVSYHIIELGSLILRETRGHTGNDGVDVDTNCRAI